MTDLKPCPFCGGRPRVRQVQADEWVIECISPLLPLCAANIGQQNGLGKAALAWNRRASSASETAALRKVRDEMQTHSNLWGVHPLKQGWIAALDAILEQRK